MHVSVSVQESTAITLCDCTAVFKAKSEHLHAIMLTNVCKHDVCFFFYSSNAYHVEMFHSKPKTSTCL